MIVAMSPIMILMTSAIGLSANAKSVVFMAKDAAPGAVLLSGLPSLSIIMDTFLRARLSGRWKKMWLAAAKSMDHCPCSVAIVGATELPRSDNNKSQKPGNDAKLAMVETRTKRAAQAHCTERTYGPTCSAILVWTHLLCHPNL